MYEIIKLIGALLIVTGSVGLWFMFSIQRRCRYCGTKNAPVEFHGRRMCVACYREYVDTQAMRRWYNGQR